MWVCHEWSSYLPFRVWFRTKNKSVCVLRAVSIHKYLAMPWCHKIQGFFVTKLIVCNKALEFKINFIVLANWYTQ